MPRTRPYAYGCPPKISDPKGCGNWVVKLTSLVTEEHRVTLRSSYMDDIVIAAHIICGVRDFENFMLVDCIRLQNDISPL